MSAALGMTVRRRQLGIALAALRETSGVTAITVADLLGCTPPHVYHLEAGRNIPTKLELQAMLSLYQAMDRLPELEEIRLRANERGWWSAHRLPPWLATYVGLETGAGHVQQFTLELVPGLLQTEDYARELMRLHGIAEAEAERHTEVRAHRQTRITKGEVTYSAVVSEALPHRLTGMGEVGATQLQHLLTMGDLDNVHLAVLPFAGGAHFSMSSGFTLLIFPDDILPPVLYWDSPVRDVVVEDPEVVSWARERYQLMVERSVGLTTEFFPRAKRGKR